MDKLDVELLVVVLDRGAEERRFASAVREFTRSAENQGVDVRRCGKVPCCMPSNVRVARRQEGLVPCLHLRHEG